MSSLPLSLLDLPIEILSEICQLTGVLPLVYLCSHLRDIIYASKSFWSSININDSNRDEPEAEIFLRRRLERGGSFSLDVNVVLSTTLRNRDMELLEQISLHKDRIRTLFVDVVEAESVEEVLIYVLLVHRPPEASLLSKIHLRSAESRFMLSPRDLLQPTPTLFPSLTTLILPLFSPCILFPDSPIVTLKTLVFDGSNYGHCPLYHILKLLAQTPNLETVWCKQQTTHNGHDVYVNYVNASWTEVPLREVPATHKIKVPIHLAKLTKVAVAVPGLGLELLRAIDAPELADLHMDGTRDDPDVESDAVAWLEPYPVRVHETLEIIASRSPLLRRLAFVGAYIPRNGWEWLLGCVDGQEIPFPMLESLALREMEEFRWEVTNSFNNSFLEKYAYQGRVRLRRFAYLNSEPLISGAVLHQLVNSIARSQTADDELFELEMDRHFTEDTKSRLEYLLTMGVKAIHYEEPVHAPNWWTLGKGIDPTEAGSY